MFPTLYPFNILPVITGDVEGLIDDTVEGGRGVVEESGEGDQGSGEEDSDDNIQKKRKRCKPFTRIRTYTMYQCVIIVGHFMHSFFYLCIIFLTNSF